MNRIKLTGLGGCLAALTIFAYTASAQTFLPITYVDATHGAGGNTTMIDGSVWNAATSATAGEWLVRGFGNNTTIYENGGNEVAETGDNAHPLRTNVSGLNADTYDVFVYFWSDVPNNGWRIRASLTEGDGDWPLYTPATEGVVQFYDGGDATIFSSSLAENPFTGDVMVAEGNRRLFQAHVGTFTGTEFSVFINDGPSTTNNDRTWYDGVGYSVVPEPSTYALFAGLGVFALIVLRRRLRR